MYTLNCHGRLLVVDKPIAMGVINTTPDSFFAGSRQQSIDGILATCETMLRDGASILDIGGQSTRPGSLPVSVDEELSRVIPPIASIREHFPDAIISVDTWYGPVARAAVEAGASLVNDVTAGTADPTLHSTIAELKVPYVLMHMKGNPTDMQASAHYNNVTLEVLDFLANRVAHLQQLGVKDIIIDPGFGFAKTIDHNFILLRELHALRVTGLPILVGLSRKSTVYKTLGTTPELALNGTTVVNTMALMNGASILRVHDVAAAMDAIRLFNRYTGAHH